MNFALPCAGNKSYLISFQVAFQCACVSRPTGPAREQEISRRSDQMGHHQPAGHEAPETVPREWIYQ